MASAFSHPVVPLTLALALGSRLVPPRLLALACVVSILPDADVLAFSFGIPYGSAFGHRGFTHSLCFAAGLGLIGVWCRRGLLCSRLAAFGVLFVATASHGLLDALTNGGAGIAFLWPLNDHRYFLPWRPVEVSPIGVAAFFTSRGWNVLRSEWVWIWLPALTVGGVAWWLRHYTRFWHPTS